MPLYAQVKDGMIKNIWDSLPPVAIGEDGWVNAIESIPILTPRQKYGDYTYTITQDLVTISREVLEVPFEIKKQQLLDDNIRLYKTFLQEVSSAPAAFSSEFIQSNIQITKTRQAKIESSTTYDDLDMIVLSPLPLF